MANYANLLATIAANIYTNNNNEVTASMVKSAMDPVVGALETPLAFSKFFILAGAQQVEVRTDADNYKTDLVIPGIIPVFDYLGGYRFIAAGTYTCNSGYNLCLSESDSQYQEVNMASKGSGETIYLYPVKQDAATNGQNECLVGAQFSRSWWSPFFMPEADLLRDLRWNAPKEVAYTTGAFIVTRNATVDITTPTASAAWSYAVLNCSPGDKFLVAAHASGILASAWCFIDSGGNVLEQSSDDEVNEIVTAPANASKLVLNLYPSLTPAGWKSYTAPSKIMEYDWTEDVVSHRFNDYAPGWIDFSVKVNQYIQDLTDTRDQTLDGESFEDVPCILKLPREYNPTGKPVRLVMICHGSGTTIDQYKVQTEYNRIATAFVDAGYAVFDCSGYKSDAYGCGFWGAPRGISGYYHAYEYVINNYNVEHDFSIYAFSMGGLTALGLASRCAPNIKCVALGAPVVDLQDAWTYTSRHPYIAAAYGFADADTYEIDKTIGCDPTLGIVTIGADEYYFRTLPPIKVWHGSEDTVSPAASLRLVNAIKKNNGMADYRLISGAGHEICYGGDTAIIPEFVYYINRF